MPDELNTSLKVMHHMIDPNFVKFGSKYYLESTFIFNQSLSTVLVSISHFPSNEFHSGGVQVAIIVVLVVIAIEVF